MVRAGPKRCYRFVHGIPCDSETPEVINSLVLPRQFTDVTLGLVLLLLRDYRLQILTQSNYK